MSELLFQHDRYSPHLQKFCRCGLPNGVRQKIWRQILLPVPERYTRIRNWVKNVGKGVVRMTEWLTDDVLRLDVSEHGGSDPRFFPFDDLMEKYGGRVVDIFAVQSEQFRVPM